MAALPTFVTETNAVATEISESVATAFRATSTTSNSIGTGDKFFYFDTTSTAFQVGQRVKALAGATFYMVGNINTVAVNYIRVTVDYTVGSTTAALWYISILPDTTDAGTMVAQDADSVAITGGAIDGTTIGATTATTGKFTTVTASTGILFGTDTAAANTLDDYEEGTFTPTAYGGTITGTTTYTERVGYYTKIGNRVDFHLFINGSNSGGSGVFTIAGLPFSSVNNTQQYSMHRLNVTSDLSISGIPACYTIIGTTTLLIGSTDTTGAFSNINISSSFSFHITGTYWVS